MITNGFFPSRKPTDIEVKRATIANVVGSSALTIGVGSALQPGATGHNLFTTIAAATNPVLGVVVGLVYQGKVTEVSSIVGTNAASTGGGVLTANVYNDNETTGYWQVDYIPSFIPLQWKASLQQISGTTTNSGGIGYFNIYATTAGAGTLDETSIALFSGTQGQFLSYGVPVASTSIVGHWSKIL